MKGDNKIKFPQHRKTKWWSALKKLLKEGEFFFFHLHSFIIKVQARSFVSL